MYLEEQADTDRIVIGIENRHVRKDFRVRCLVTSTMDWHRFGKYDDEVSIFYKVVPPLS
jgi:hypothetical protein